MCENCHCNKEQTKEYDKDFVPDEAYLKSLPDINNDPNSVIKGAKVKIQQVGIHNFKLPLKYSKKDGGTIELETSVTGTVSLEDEQKGINMSRIMRSFYDFKDDEFNVDKLDDILAYYKEKLGSFDSRILLQFSYPMLQKSLRSNKEGYQYYNIGFEAVENKKIIHFDFVYSSACPCSYELGQHAERTRNKPFVSHSQRSVARISVVVKKEEILWFEDLKDICLEALKTETQVMVVRQDEQAFAEMNGSYLKFVEDASRLLYEQLDKDSRIEDFRVICLHLESLHSHNAASTIVKGIEQGFTSEVEYAVFDDMIRKH